MVTAFKVAIVSIYAVQFAILAYLYVLIIKDLLF